MGTVSTEEKSFYEFLVEKAICKNKNEIFVVAWVNKTFNFQGMFKALV